MLKADLVLLATGFVHVEHGKLLHDWGLSTDPRGNLSVDSNGMASSPGIFAAGDSVGAQVWPGLRRGVLPLIFPLLTG